MPRGISEASEPPLRVGANTDLRSAWYRFSRQKKNEHKGVLASITQNLVLKCSFCNLQDRAQVKSKSRTEDEQIEGLGLYAKQL